MDNWRWCDLITNEIVAMVVATIDEQFGKFILPDKEHDLTLFKLMEQKQKTNASMWFMMQNK